VEKPSLPKENSKVPIREHLIRLPGPKWKKSLPNFPQNPRAFLVKEILKVSEEGP